MSWAFVEMAKPWKHAMPSANRAKQMLGLDDESQRIVISLIYGMVARVQGLTVDSSLGHIDADYFGKCTDAFCGMHDDGDALTGGIGGQGRSVVGVVALLIDRTDVTKIVRGALGRVRLGHVEHHAEGVGIPTGSELRDVARDMLLCVCRKNSGNNDRQNEER